MPKVLVIEDDAALRAMLEQLLAAGGHTVESAGDGVEGARLFRAGSFDVILTDIVMPNREGLETIFMLRRDFPNLPVIAMSGGTRHSQSYLEMATKLGATHTLAKPFSQADLEAAIAGAMGTSRK